jgi:hypothetical protein
MRHIETMLLLLLTICSFVGYQVGKHSADKWWASRVAEGHVIRGVALIGDCRIVDLASAQLVIEDSYTRTYQEMPCYIGAYFMQDDTRGN